MLDRLPMLSMLTPVWIPDHLDLPCMHLPVHSPHSPLFLRRAVRRTLTHAVLGLQICSDINKPDGQYVLPATRDAVMAFLKTLPVRKVRPHPQRCSWMCAVHSHGPQGAQRSQPGRLEHKPPAIHMPPCMDDCAVV